MTEVEKAIEQAMDGDPASLLGLAKESGYRTALVYPGYFPLELLDACGMWSVTLWHYFDVAPADAHLPPFACTFSKAFLSFALEHRDSFDCIALSNICDTAQNAFAILKKLFPEKDVLWFYLPQNPASRASGGLVRSQLGAMWDTLSGGAALDALADAIAERNRARAKLAFMSDLRAQGRLKAGIWTRALFSYFCTPARLANALLARMAESAREARESSADIALYAIGKMIMPADALEFLDAQGVALAGDSLLLGLRSRLGEVVQSGDPLDDLARSLVELPASPYHHADPYDYPASVASDAKRLGARGAVVFRLKYCDPDGFDYPAIKRALDGVGIPSLLLEVEMKRSLAGAEKTRLEAFIESLKETVSDAT